jgi:Ser/Thr protein kinase RdoA (MazF antagonist)
MSQNQSSAAKIRQLHKLATAALANYDLADARITFHAFETNLLYRVTTASGERFMLRLASPGWRSLDDLRSEAMWLHALKRDTDICAPEIVPTCGGQDVVPVSLEGISGVWNATLMTWVPGRLLGHFLNEANLEKMGRLFAGMHRHGAAWMPPAGFTTRRFEHWLSRGEEKRLFADGAQLLPSAMRDLLERMDRRGEAAYTAVDRADLRVIHCDLWHDNIKLYHGRLYPFDFEDIVWGFRSHDIAMAMLDLLETVGEERYPDLLASFRRGYESELAWPDDPIEPFQIGRLLWKINWVARYQPQWLGSMVERHVPVFEHFESTGKVILPHE